ncbi:MAG: hypothetical protein HGB18_03685 [Candidatus Moranbacteria bacterium]|nr:hypothetical protein [Candidatus Moranbacteria bacterium]
MSVKNTPFFLAMMFIGSITMATAIFSALFAMNHAPEPAELFRFAVPKIMWATLAKWCFSLAFITYWLVSRSDKIDKERERKWHRISLSTFLSLHPEFWNIREEINDTGWEPKLRLPK